MTFSEFRHWLGAYMPSDQHPTPDQWAKISAMISAVEDVAPTTGSEFLDRHWGPYAVVHGQVETITEDGTKITSTVVRPWPFRSGPDFNAAEAFHHLGVYDRGG